MKTDKLDEINDLKIVCVANSYIMKYYLNPVYEKLPQMIKDEIKSLCVLFTEDVGGILILRFNEDKLLEFESIKDDDDYYFDEVGSVLKIKKIKIEKKELIKQMETYYKLVILGEK